MPRRKSQGEQRMLAITVKAEDEVRARYDGVDGVEKIIPSWTGVDLILDVKLATAGWLRLAYVPEDDMEVAGVRELA